MGYVLTKVSLGHGEDVGLKRHGEDVVVEIATSDRGGAKGYVQCLASEMLYVHSPCANICKAMHQGTCVRAPVVPTRMCGCASTVCTYPCQSTPEGLTCRWQPDQKPANKVRSMG